LELGALTAEYITHWRHFPRACLYHLLMVLFGLVKFLTEAADLVLGLRLLLIFLLLPVLLLLLLWLLLFLLLLL